jgi:hypothetical protein
MRAGGFPVDAGPVHADRFDAVTARGSEDVEELDQGALGATFFHPDDVAGVMIGDDGKELEGGPPLCRASNPARLSCRAAY